jgi:thiamine-phosphate pyrophosphorylase
VLALRGFYAVLDREDEALARALARHACVLQVRIKPGDPLPAARMARRITREAGIPLVVNDRIDVALAVGADGVHLGQTDLPLGSARRLLGGHPMLIGVSTHDLDQVRAARGADYLGFGPVFATSTKANPDPVRGLELLAEAVRATPLPVVAIGGITPERAPGVAATGAAAACAIAAVNREINPGEAGRQIAAAFRK